MPDQTSTQVESSLNTKLKTLELVLNLKHHGLTEPALTTALIAAREKAVREAVVALNEYLGT
jgi:hypothetical protein